MAGWAAERLSALPSVPTSTDPGDPDWRPARHYFGLTAFGINAVTKDADNVLIPEHDERASGQQEIYFVHCGSVRVTLDGETHEAPEGAMIAVEPNVSRKIESTSSPTTLIAVGGTPGKAYEVGEWEL